MYNEDVSVGDKVGGILIGAAGIPLTIAFNAFVFCKLWVWFIVDQFNADPLSFINAMGIGTLISFLTYRSRTKKDDNEDSFTFKALKLVSKFLITASIYLLAGFIIQSFK